MNRIFNCLIVLFLAGVYFVYSSSIFTENTAEATSVQSQPSNPLQAQLVSDEAGAGGMIVNASLGFGATETPLNPTLVSIPKKNGASWRDYPVMTKAELQAAKEQFLARRLASSTLIREVPLNITLVNASPAQVAQVADENLLLISGNVVNARSAPTTNSNVIAKLKRGTQVAATGENKGSWVQVVVVETDKTVWVYNKFLKETL